MLFAIACQPSPQRPAAAAQRTALGGPAPPRSWPCLPSTMYRLLAQEGETKERRNQLRHPHYHKPVLLATAPNQVWSWDITRLLGPVKWTYFYLYVILDICSRWLVGWMVAPQESAALAKRLLSATCEKQGVIPGQLIPDCSQRVAQAFQPVQAQAKACGYRK